MTYPELYFSVRMRAAAERRHVSGAERMVQGEQLDEAMRDLCLRAQGRSTAPDSFVLTIEKIVKNTLITQKALSIISTKSQDLNANRRTAAKMLREQGISEYALEEAMRQLDEGPSSSGTAMRGAMIIGAASGKRLERDIERGIRVSRFDWAGSSSVAMQAMLAEAGLTHHRTFEAIALATKIAYAPSVIAELCWSDDPDYIAGYVASRNFGYMRFPVLKKSDVNVGGRAIFVHEHTMDLDTLYRYCEKQPVLITLPDGPIAIS